MSDALPLSFSVADFLYSRDDYIAYLASALETGDDLYISRALFMLAEATGVDCEDEMAVLLGVARKLGVRLMVGKS